MVSKELLFQDSIATPNLPVNFYQADLEMFQNALEISIPAIYLLHLENVKVSPKGILFYKNKILPESFPAPEIMSSWTGPKAKLMYLVRERFFIHYEKVSQEIVWITDTWSQGYFHWMADALPRLFSIRKMIKHSTLLLPGAYRQQDFIESSLEPFLINDVQFIDEGISCERFKIPTRTAPTGNYNEYIMRGLRKLYTDFYQGLASDFHDSKIYISRSKAARRKIANEEECINIIEKYGFKQFTLKITHSHSK